MKLRFRTGVLCVITITLCIRILALAKKDCISTLHEFQQSLVNRTVNLDSLGLAFSPANHQTSISFAIHYHFCSNSNDSNSTTDILCSNIEKWANEINAGRSPSVDFSGRYTHKFQWNASPINLFIRPELLASLSLFTFQINIQTTHIILDQLCEDIIYFKNLTSSDISPGLNDSCNRLNICSQPPPVLLLLQELTVDVS